MKIKLAPLLLLLLVTFSANSSDFIPANQMFVSEQYQSFAISPDGKTLLGKSFIDGYQQLFAFGAGSKQAAEVFKLTTTDRKRILDYDWLDKDTAYVSFLGTFNTYYIRIIDFTFKDNDFEIDYYDIRGLGILVNPMLGVEDKALLAKLNAKEKKLDLLELDLSKLRNIKHNSKNHKKIFSTFRNLSEDLEDTYKFYVSDSTYELEMIGQSYDDYNTYSVYDSKTGSWKEFFRVNKNTSEEKNYSKLDVFTPITKVDDSHIVALSNINRDKVAVVLFNIETQKDVEVLYESEYYDVKAATYSREQKKLISVSYADRGLNKQKFLDKGSNDFQSKLVQKIGLESVFIIDRSVTGSDYLIFAHDASNPGRFYHYNLANDKLRFLQSSMPDLYPYSFTKADILTTTNDLGNKVEGFLYTGDSSKKMPMVVMPHGGPIGVQDLNEFDREVQFLVNRGFAVLTINFRGSSGYGKKYMSAGREQFGKGIEADIDKLVSKAISLPLIDSDKVCIYGKSYGGYSAITSTILYPGTYKCAISGFGVFDLPLLYSASNLHHSEDVKDAISFVVGDIDTKYEELKANSPLYKADQIKVPTLLFAGKNDEIAHPEHSRRLDYVLNKIGQAEVDYYEYLHSGHGHPDWAGDRHQLITVVDFLNKHISPELTITKKNKTVIAEDYFLLGLIYYHGYYLKKDHDEAEKYLRLAHSNGSEEAAKYLRRLGVYDF
ncbi:alpha/beta hydrolase family protein [Kangiella spongicola]|uniref:Peptidase S9 prolyl oligopeptidase catalytic domain-containing protein n=1 Tax=Kangiella spongicola TaxID=796379 RepID=A0A318D274_9GAMM|nr:prolyl oligopeptidase family serine peptidase [Kangiella spongicola]PXF63081.1 hypothetical protein DL796_06415 [Kangiella spongicola]